MPELGWREAILRVLDESAEAMHYADIAEAITAQKMHTNVGATPAATVNAAISNSLNREGEQSPFVRVDRGRYWLRGKIASQGRSSAREAPPNALAAEASGTGLLNAFGMYWARNQVIWSATPRLLGQQQTASTSVDFCNQKGVYLLHDGRAVVYVGRTTEQPLGLRLRQHIADRLNGRWDRFSWFGIYPVDEQSGAIKVDAIPQFDLSMLIATMEALLIEGLEPPQNRKRGDDFRAVEFLQLPDPDLKKNELRALIVRLSQQL